MTPRKSHKRNKVWKSNPLPREPKEKLPGNLISREWGTN
jgi:hypothetical protein